jgi:hypothetical protein
LFFGVPDGGVPVEGVDRCQPRVAGADGIAAVLLEVGEERSDHRRVEVGDVQLAGLLAGLPLGEAQ